MSDESVLSTLHRGGEGQNVYRMIFFPTLVTKVVGMSLALQYYAGHVGSGGRVKDNNKGNGKLFILLIS